MTASHLTFLLRKGVRSLWFTPAVYAAVALGVLAGANTVAPILPDGLKGRIGLSGVYDLLSVLANTLLAVSIFSLGIMASSMHAASSVATPRVRPLLMQDRTAQSAISTFIGGFVYAIVGIVGLSTNYYSEAARTLLFLVTCLVILAVIVALIRWIRRLSRLGDVTEAITLVEKATRAALDDLAASPNLGGAPALTAPKVGFPIGPEALGFVHVVDVGQLGALADRLELDLHLVARPGTFVGPGRPLVIADAPLAEKDCAKVRDAFVLGDRRTFEADPRFGMIVLSEIGSRALSPGINDPGTAIDVIATAVRLLAGWSRAAAKARPQIRHHRLHVTVLPVGDLLGDAFRWIARDGASQIEVQIWIQKGLATLIAQDEALFGQAARALSREALARAEEGLSMPQDLERVRAAAAEVGANR